MYLNLSRNPNTALANGLGVLRSHGLIEPSRNGPVLVMPMPVTTVTQSPMERVVFSPLRDANPFFHLAEAVWMLCGRNDVAFLTRYAQQLGLYSDDGLTLNGAYGHRWRSHFGYDQLREIIDEMYLNKSSRRCVLTMWDGARDLDTAIQGGKDVPCNTHIYFRVRPVAGASVLDMTVCCRSNDAVWGAHGANVVHFSVLMEFVARFVGVQLGHMYQLSNNYHIYTEREDVRRLVDYVPVDLYSEGTVVPEPLVTNTTRGYAEWLRDAATVLDAAGAGAGAVGSLLMPRTADPFLAYTLRPMLTAHELYKDGDHVRALDAAKTIRASDWRTAAIQWLQRRKNWTGERGEA